jgi:hypothetical protein
MKAVLVGLALVAVAISGCYVGKWEHGEGWEAQGSEAPRSSPYMPTVGDEEKLREALHHSWVEIHSGDTGLVGYLEMEIEGMYDIEGPKKIFYVYNATFERIGFITDYGSTYRYVFDDYKQTKVFVGHYEQEEGLAHLLKVPVPVELKTLTAKPPEF